MVVLRWSHSVWTWAGVHFTDKFPIPRCYICWFLTFSYGVIVDQSPPQLGVPSDLTFPLPAVHSLWGPRIPDFPVLILMEWPQILPFIVDHWKICCYSAYLLLFLIHSIHSFWYKFTFISFTNTFQWCPKFDTYSVDLEAHVFILNFIWSLIRWSMGDRSIHSGVHSFDRKATFTFWELVLFLRWPRSTGELEYTFVWSHSLI